MMSLVSLRGAANTSILTDAYSANSSRTSSAAPSRATSRKSSSTNLADDAASTHSNNTPAGSVRSAKKWFSKIHMPKNNSKHANEAAYGYRVFGLR